MAARAVALVVAITSFALSAATNASERDPHQRALFMKKHPCPANGKTRGACPGHVVDHMKPLCAGGADRPSNMQWQTREESKIKDRREREMCRGYRNNSR